MLRFLQNLANESIPIETTLCFSCEPNGHVGKNHLQILSFKIPLTFLQSKGSLEFRNHAWQLASSMKKM
jgi:hypothetical protein